MALVWLAGPVSGTLVQPFFGRLSDQCHSRWGRRRPFIVLGGVAVILSLLGLAFTPDIVRSASLLLPACSQSEQDNSDATLGTTVFLIWMLNISIQPVQGCLRALIVDSCPASQQDTANAWAGRIINASNIVMHLCGFADLPRFLPILGNSQFKILCILASIFLGLALALTCWTIREPDARRVTANTLERINLFSKIWYLPRQIQRILEVQFFSWMGWFGFLFYIST